MSEPLQQLTKKDQPFQWLPQHERSFNQIEELLTSAKATAYFDPKNETELITDASPTGLSAILMQRSPSSEEKRVVAYVSRTLTPVERCWSEDSDYSAMNAVMHWHLGNVPLLEAESAVADTYAKFG